jgi:hypothetical protein
MLDAPIVRLILAYHLTCSRWKCSWGEGTHWKASGTYVKSKNIPLQTELSWAIWFRDNPGLVHWCSATSTDGMSHHPAAPRPPSLLQHVQHLGLEDRVYSLAQKCQWPPWHWNLVVIYIYWTISWNGKTRHARLPCLVFLLEQNTKMDTRTHQRCGFSCTCLGLPRDRASTLTLLPDWGMENTSTTRTSESRCNL